MEARPRCNKQPYCTNVTSHHIVKYTHDEGTDQAAALLLHLATHRDVCRYGRKCSDSTSYHRLTYLHFCSSGLSCEDTAPDHRDSYVHSTPPPRARVDDPGSEDDAPMASGVTHRDVVTDAADVALLLEANRSGRRVRRPCKRAAGVFPVATDPTTGRCWVLLGLSTRKQDHVLCHFHGFTDPGETSFIGAAREGWEESKGCFASRSTLWRALTASSLQCAGDSTFAVPFMNRHCYLVHLGDYTESERQRLCDAFHAAPVYSKCMAEVASLHWIAGDELAVACRSAAETRQHSDSIRVTGFPEGARLRGFLGKWLTADAGEWQRDDRVSLLERGDASRIPLLPLSQLPALHLEGHELLDFLEAIGIPFCGVCRTEGHTTEQHVPIVYDE